MNTLTHCKDDWGVDPEDGFFVSMTAAEIKKMNELRREWDILKDRSDQARATSVTSQWIEQKLGDTQLAAAHRALLGKLADEPWPVVGEAGGELIIQQTQRATLKAERRRAKEYLAELERKLAVMDVAKSAGDDDAAVGQPPADDSAVDQAPTVPSTTP